MKDILFVLKTFVATMILIVLMQIKVGSFTMEEQAALFIQDSWMTTQVQQVAAGLSKVLKDTTGGFGKKVSSLFGGSPESQGRSKWGFERSEGAKAAQDKSNEKRSAKLQDTAQGD
jgi:hypothetical protein